MSKALKVAIAVCVACVLALTAIGVFGIISMVNISRENSVKFEEAVAYMESLPEGNGAVYAFSNKVFSSKGEAQVPDGYDVICIDKEHIYSLYDDDNDKRHIIRTDYSFDNPTVILTTEDEYQVDMADSQTALYYFGDCVYVYHIDTGKTEEYTNVSYRAIYKALTPENDYEVVFDDDTDEYVISVKNGDMLWVLNEERQRALSQSEHLAKAAEILDTEMSIYDVYAIGDAVYIDTLMGGSGFNLNYLFITYRFDPVSDSFTYVGFCTPTDGALHHSTFVPRGNGTND